LQIGLAALRRDEDFLQLREPADRQNEHRYGRTDLGQARQ
jgi:hypothetical protein